MPIRAASSSNLSRRVEDDDHSVTDKVARLTPYSARRVARRRNRADGIYRQGGSGPVLALERRGGGLRNGFTGTITMGIDPS